MNTKFILEGNSYCVQDLERLKAATSLNDLHRLNFFNFLSRWFSSDPFIEVKTSGSTGIPKQIHVNKDAMRKSAHASIKYFNLKPQQSVLIALPLHYIAGIMMTVRALEANMDIYLTSPSSNPLQTINQKFDFAPFTPMQMSIMLEEGMKNKLEQIETILLGGSSISDALSKKIQSLKCKIFSSYGMTETLSHIALRRINGKLREETYHPLPGVHISYSKNKTLAIETPWTKEQLITTDLITIHQDGSFTFIGRDDATINSGGIKLHPEELEAILAPLISCPFALSSIEDKILGEALILVTEQNINFKEFLLKASLKLNKYQLPKKHFTLNIPLTTTGKIARKELKQKLNRLSSLI